MSRRLLAAAASILVLCSSVAAGGQAQRSGAALEAGSVATQATERQPRARGRSDLDRTVSVAFADVRLDAAIDKIAAAAGVTILYTARVLPVEKIVSETLVDVPLRQALRQVLEGTGTVVQELKPGQLVLVKEEKPGSSRKDAANTVSGRVTAAAGDTSTALPGVSVMVKGTQLTATTDAEGAYILTDVPAGRQTLVARMVGYRPSEQTVVVPDAGDLRVSFMLSTLPLKLEELITTATGQQRRRDLGNAITTIRADSVLRTAPIRNLTDLLENRVPGLNIQHTSGAPGDPARLRLRGISSVMRGNDPVVIVDGVRVYASQSDPRSGNLTNLGAIPYQGIEQTSVFSGVRNTPAPSPLDQIDPNTIDKIEVFKGPSAATLYGADAANGVIVITTKRGKPGPTRWSVNLTQGQTTTPGRYPEGYYQWGRQIFTGSPMFCTLANLACLPDSLARFQALNDPELTVLGRGRRTAVSLTGSGGTQALTYSLTGTYSDETGLLTLPAFEAERFRTRFNRAVPDWMQRPHQLTDWSVASNVTARLSETADVTFSSSLSRKEQQRSSLEQQVAPLSGTYVDRATGQYYRPEAGYALMTTIDVLRNYYIRTTASSINFKTGLNAVWRPRAWFNATAQAGLDVMPRDDQVYLPAGTLSLTDSGVVVQGTGRSLASTFNLQGSLRKPLGLGFIFETAVGANLFTLTTGDLVSSAAGLKPGTSTIDGANRITAMNRRESSSVFGWYIEPRIAGQRLALSTGIRLDGGSSYGTRVTGTAGAGLLSLPKLNGSWVISEEPFFPFKSLFSSLRLRAAYGQAQVQPGPMDRLRLYTRGVYTQGFDQSPLLTLTTLGNSQLRPERSTEFEGGFDADVFDSRVSLELTAYRKLQVDALMPVKLPSSVNGGGSVVQNIGNILNKGVELTFKVTPVLSPLLTWSAELNYTHNANKLVELGRGVEANPLGGIVAGYPVGGRWARPIISYGDANGNGILQPDEVKVGDSLVYLGQLHPQHQTGLHTSVALFGGALSLTASVNYEAGGTQVDETARTNWVFARALIDGGTPFSEQAAVLVYDSTTYGLTQDIATFRFNSLSVNYRAPARVARLLRAEELTVALQGSNLGLHSTYRGKDPDVSAWSPSETIVDTGQLPQPRTWQLAVFLRY